eukprot:364708-Chlamydomonas_euryale.AAC.10
MESADWQHGCHDLDKGLLKKKKKKKKARTSTAPEKGHLRSLHYSGVYHHLDVISRHTYTVLASVQRACCPSKADILALQGGRTASGI